jgi:hypothetical protein
MTDPRLREVVDDIQQQLARAEGLNDQTRRSLELLVRDLETLLAREPGQPVQSEHGATLRDRVDDAVRRVEASHPALSTTLGNVVDALAFFNL